MKKSLRLFITGSMQSLFYKQFIKTNAEERDVRGFLRIREDRRVEVFLEGESTQVNAMVAICKRGPKYTQIRKVEEQQEKFQDFKDFRILEF
tara:strand:+ start:124 stop:399 length:276 start_codon:yes stop_codon:yes gene_type:complete